MQASLDDLTINLAQIWSNRVISLIVADLGAVLAIPCRRQTCRSTGIEMTTAISTTPDASMPAGHQADGVQTRAGGAA
jgi:hypothetical protein